MKQKITLSALIGLARISIAIYDRWKAHQDSQRKDDDSEE